MRLGGLFVVCTVCGFTTALFPTLYVVAFDRLLGSVYLLVLVVLQGKSMRKIITGTVLVLKHRGDSSKCDRVLLFERKYATFFWNIMFATCGGIISSVLTITVPAVRRMDPFYFPVMATLGVIISTVYLCLNWRGRASENVTPTLVSHLPVTASQLVSESIPNQTKVNIVAEGGFVREVSVSVNGERQVKQNFPGAAKKKNNFNQFLKAWINDHGVLCIQRPVLARRKKKKNPSEFPKPGAYAFVRLAGDTHTHTYTLTQSH